jgi:hypothetical protein
MAHSENKSNDALIIEDVMNNVHDTLIQSGIDESVIKLLRDMWLLKLEKNENSSNPESGSESDDENVIVIAESGDTKNKSEPSKKLLTAIKKSRKPVKISIIRSQVIKILSIVSL